jgi:O-antigen ligase
VSTAISHRSEAIETSSFATHPREEGRLWLFVLTSIWGIPPLAFTKPGTELQNGFDSVDAAKLAIFFGLCLLAVYCVATMWYRNATWWRFWPMAGMIAYACFGLASVVWSPLPSVTIDKAGSLGMLCLLSIAIGCLATRRESIERVIWHLSASLAVFSGFIFLMYLYDPVMAGLDRLLIHTGGDGLIHPTASGSTASLGLLVLIIAKYWFRFDWGKGLIEIAMLIHLPILVLSNSRMSILALLVTAGPILLQNTKSIHKAALLGIAALSTMVVIVVDPGLIGIGSSLAPLGDYVTRGQSGAELEQASGRGEMWEAIWAEFLKSPILGHGYFVTSETGAVEVWFIKTNHLAHNIFLQVMATTGLVGLAIFLGAMALLFFAVRKLARVEGIPRLVSQTSLVFAVWYFIWCQLADGFLGPVRPESLVFFVGCGLILAQIPAVSELENSPSKSIS